MWQSDVLLAISNPAGKVEVVVCLFTWFLIIRPSSFQQAVLKNLNERNAQLQKQLDNVIREGLISLIHLMV